VAYDPDSLRVGIDQAGNVELIGDERSEAALRAAGLRLLVELLTILMRHGPCEQIRRLDTPTGT
jgi:hypothetical protein